MRGMKSTLALLVVLIGLGAYAYFYASKAEDTSATKQDKLFPTIASDNIEELTVRNDTGETTTLKKVDGKWMMTAPVQTRASDMDASGIANGLAGLDITRVVDENPTDVKDYGLDIYDMRYIDEVGMKRAMEEALEDIDDNTHVHVSFDVDFLDPAIAPGVGTTVPGGPNYREAQLVMEMIADTGKLGSLDIVELNPAFDEHNKTAQLAVDLVESLFGKSTLLRMHQP